MNNYEKIMKKCISLAKKGIGRVSPNPLVGCVVLNKKGEIIAQGYHHKYGKNHAERDALLIHIICKSGAVFTFWKNSAMRRFNNRKRTVYCCYRDS